MKLVLLLLTLINGAAISNDLGSGSMESLASEALDLLESTTEDRTKGQKIQNFRDNVMKVSFSTRLMFFTVKFLLQVLNRISDIQHCRQVISKRLQPKGQLTLDALATEMCFVNNWMDKIAEKCVKSNKCFDWKYIQKNESKVEI